MSSFKQLFNRAILLTEAKDSPMDRILPGFQTQARAIAAAQGASSGTREGRLALLNILYDLDIIDLATLKMFKNDPSVSRMVSYFEQNNIATTIKEREDDIRQYVRDKLEQKVSFNTNQRSDTAQQKYELNKLNNELKATKKEAKKQGQKETSDAMTAIKSIADNYADLVGSLQASYADNYMIEIMLDKQVGLSNMAKVIEYLSQYADEDEIDVNGRSVDIVISTDSHIGKLIAKLGAAQVEKSIAHDLKKFGGGGVVVHEPDKEHGSELTRNLKGKYEDEEMYMNPEEEAEDDVVSDSEVRPTDLPKQLGVAVDKGDVVLTRSEDTPDVLDPTLFGLPPGTKIGNIEDFAASNFNTGLEDSQPAVKSEDEDEDEEHKKNYKKTHKESTGTGAYMSDLVIKESRNTSTPQQYISFKDKYKPKTYKQLNELRNYGL